MGNQAHDVCILDVDPLKNGFEEVFQFGRGSLTPELSRIGQESLDLGVIEVGREEQVGHFFLDACLFPFILVDRVAAIPVELVQMLKAGIQVTALTFNIGQSAFSGDKVGQDTILPFIRQGQCFQRLQNLGFERFGLDGRLG